MDYTIDEIISKKASRIFFQTPLSVANIQIQINDFTENKKHFNFSITKQNLSTLILGNLIIKYLILQTWNGLKKS